MPDLFVKRLRRQMSYAEKILWHSLRNRYLVNAKFRRQVRMGSYVADFVCLKKKVIVECDGPHHLSQLEYDEVRDSWFNGKGFVVIRVRSDDVISDGETVLKRIRSVLELRVYGNPHPDPLP